MQVSRNYLASLQQLVGDLEELGVEVVAVSADGRERAEAFVRTPSPRYMLSLKVTLSAHCAQSFSSACSKVLSRCFGRRVSAR